jgi:hypothetical protein
VGSALGTLFDLGAHSFSRLLDKLIIRLWHF